MIADVTNLDPSAKTMADYRPGVAVRAMLHELVWLRELDRAKCIRLVLAAINAELQEQQGLQYPNDVIRKWIRHG
jgi:hypothetical protein